MQLVDTPELNFGLQSAQKVADALHFPLRVFDFREDFRKIIIDSSLEKYHNGLTPNPCVVCNHRIKFGFFGGKAQKEGFVLMATGHYVRKTDHNGLFQLWQAKDKKKDRSYFLWWLG